MKHITTVKTILSGAPKAPVTEAAKTATKQSTKAHSAAPVKNEIPVKLERTKTQLYFDTMQGFDHEEYRGDLQAERDKEALHIKYAEDTPLQDLSSKQAIVAFQIKHKLAEADTQKEKATVFCEIASLEKPVASATLRLIADEPNVLDVQGCNTVAQAGTEVLYDTNLGDKTITPVFTKNCK